MSLIRPRFANLHRRTVSFRRTTGLVISLCTAAACSENLEIRTPVDIVANPRSVVTTVGTQVALGATVSGVEEPVRLEWRSLAPGLAVVDPTTATGAVVLGVAQGTTPIVVNVLGRTDVADTIVVTVQAPLCTLQSITMSPNQATIAAGDTVRLRAAVPQCNGQPADTNVIWTSLQPTIANVDSFGLVTGLAPGVATIRAASRQSPNIVAVATVTVR